MASGPWVIDLNLPQEHIDAVFRNFILVRKDTVKKAQERWPLWAVDMNQFQECKNEIYKKLHEWRVEYIHIAKAGGANKVTQARIDVLLLRLIMP